MVASRLPELIRLSSLDLLGCTEWPRPSHKYGYGYVRVGDGRRIGTHVAAWELTHLEQVPAGLDVMHSCDNPPCVNPSHLSVGTRGENMQGAAERGRLRSGADNPRWNPEPTADTLYQRDRRQQMREGTWHYRSDQT